MIAVNNCKCPQDFAKKKMHLKNIDNLLLQSPHAYFPSDSKILIRIFLSHDVLMCNNAILFHKHKCPLSVAYKYGLRQLNSSCVQLWSSSGGTESYDVM